MGFLSELGKAFMGKPLGPAGDGHAQSNQPTPANTSRAGSGILNERGLKIIPDITIQHLRSYRQGEKLLVKAWIFNESPDQVIRVDSTYLLRQKRHQNQQISPKSSHELTLYDGPAPRDENEHHAQIAYRLMVNGDAFMEQYRIDYSLESDGTRIIDDLHDDGPVRDI